MDLDEALGAMRNNIGRAVDNSLRGLAIKQGNAQREENIAQGKVLQIPQNREKCFQLRDSTK